MSGSSRFAGVVVAALAVAGLAGPLVAQSASAAPVTSTAADGVYAPDTVSAAAAARAQNRSVAVDSLTSPTTRTSVLPNGSYTYEVSTLPVRARKAGVWTKVDEALTPAEGWLEPAVSAAPVRFAAGGSNILDEVQTSSGAWVTDTWPYGTLPVPTVVGRTATYADVLPGVDLRLTATEAGMSSVYVVKTAAASSSATLAKLHTNVGGAKVSRRADGGFTADPGDGYPVAASSPLWWDASDGGTAAGPGGNDPLRPVTASLDAGGPSMDVGATVGATPVTYPVFVDPDWSSGQNASWYTDKAYPNQAYPNTNPLRVGIYAQWQSDMFFQFPIGALSGKVILAAQLSTTQLSIDACPTNAIAIETYNAPYTGFTWNQEQSWGGLWGGVMQVQTPGSCSNTGAVIGVGWNVVSGVAAKVGQSTVTFGIVSNTAAPSRRHFAPGATLTVTYDTPPSTPTAAQFVTPARSCSTNSAAPASFNGKQNVTVSVDQRDPDPGNVADNFYVQDFTTNTQALHYGTALQAQGTISWTFDASGLTDGHLYGWWARGSDYIVDGANPGPTCYFTIDNTAPVAPTVSTTASAMTIGQPIPVTVTPGSSSDVAGFEYWFAFSSATSPAASAPVVIGKTAAVPACGSQQGGASFACLSGGAATVTVAPVDDTSTLWVASFDAAGNLSAASPLVLTNSSGSAATEPASAAWHEWVPNLSGSPLPTVIPDQNTVSASDTTGEKDVTLGSALSLGVTDAIGNQSAAAVLSFPGTLSSGTLAQTGSAGVDTTQSFSASAWVKPAGTTGTMAILGQSGVSNSGFVLQDVNGQMAFCVRPQTGSGGADCATAAAVSPAGAWVMVTGVWDAVNRQVRLVLGSTMSTAVIAPHVPPSGEVTAGGVVTVGSSQAAGVAAAPWNGEIASVALIQEPADSALLSTLSGLFA